MSEFQFPSHIWQQRNKILFNNNSIGTKVIETAYLAITMKRWWLISLILLIVFEWLRVYFIMPMPGSQQSNSLEFAYFLHQYRWVFRVIFLAAILRWLPSSWKQYKKTTIFLMGVLALSAYLTNNLLSADTMFLSLRNTRFAKADKSYIETDRLVIGLSITVSPKPIQ